MTNHRQYRVPASYPAVERIVEAFGLSVDGEFKVTEDRAETTYGMEVTEVPDDLAGRLKALAEREQADLTPLQERVLGLVVFDDSNVGNYSRDGNSIYLHVTRSSIVQVARAYVPQSPFRRVTVILSIPNAAKVASEAKRRAMKVLAKRHGLETTWSVAEVDDAKDMQQAHPYSGATQLLHGDSIVVRIPGPRWIDLFIAADQAAKLDRMRHTSVEGFAARKGDPKRLDLRMGG